LEATRENEASEAMGSEARETLRVGPGRISLIEFVGGDREGVFLRAAGLKEGSELILFFLIGEIGLRDAVGGRESLTLPEEAALNGPGKDSDLGGL
jgi:hypothetical protein